jgi:D-cysteine desulfhydrase
MPLTIKPSLQSFPLAFLRTPLHPLPRLNAWLREKAPASPNVQLWIKRDDQTGLAFGGNKTRKLEFLVGDALRRGCDTLITAGAAQSNHCRQTAAAAAKARLACQLVLSGEARDAPNGNLLLDHLLGATCHWTTREDRLPRLKELERQLKAAGKKPYYITIGGSDPVGALGYAVAMEEAVTQANGLGVRFDAMVFASSSGGTHAGLVAGAWALSVDTPIVGISIDETRKDLQNIVAPIASGCSELLGKPHAFAPADIRAEDGYLGAGYGVVGDLERDAIWLLARQEGILLDPVYTGRAFGGLLDLLHRGSVAWLPHGRKANVLFWHTGGAPALFAYAADLMHPERSAPG